MKPIIRHLSLALGLGLALAAFGQFAGASLGLSASEAVAKTKHPGKRLYMRKTCVACHGRNGKRAIQDYPNVAGQEKSYLANQIMDIVNGKRTGGLNAQGKPRAEAMRGALVTPEGQPRITKEEAVQIADWLASLEPAKPNPPKDLKPEDIAAGEKLYKKKRCFTCHGKKGDKPLKGYPYIAGQKYEYIIHQMQDIRDKKRTNGKTKAMFNFVRKLTDDEIRKIAAWLSTIDRTAK